MENEELLRSVDVHYKPMVLELELPDDAEQLTNAELNKLIIEQLQNNHEALLKHMEYSVLPKETLTAKKAYVGRLVRHVETNELSVITKIGRQPSNKGLTVTYSNGCVKKGAFHEFSLINEYPENELLQFSFIQPKSRADLLDGGIYKFEINTFGVVHFNDKTNRASISCFSTENRRKVNRMGLSELIECLFHYAPLPLK